MSQIPPPAVPQYASPGPQPKPAGLAIASMVLGIIAIPTMCIWWLSIPLAILAIIFGVVARGKAKRGEGGGAGMAMAGLVCGVVALALTILLVVLALVGISMFGSELQKEIERQQKLQQQQQQQGGTSPSGMLPAAFEHVAALWNILTTLVVR